MAATAEASRLTEAHRLAQAAHGRQIVAQLLLAWDLLDLDDLDATIEQWVSLAVPLVTSGRRTSARLAANYLAAFRSLELGLAAGAPPLELAEDVSTEQVATSLIITGPAAIRAGRARGLRTNQLVEKARAAQAAAGMRHTLNGGRDTVVATVHADRQALGWARATSGKSCSFCAMLAGRGPIYGEATVGFQAHDHCSCSAEPVYRRDAAWPAGARGYEQLWQASTQGLSGPDAVNAFRRALAAR